MRTPQPPPAAADTGPAAPTDPAPRTQALTPVMILVVLLLARLERPDRRARAPLSPPAAAPAAHPPQVAAASFLSPPTAAPQPHPPPVAGASFLSPLARRPRPQVTVAVLVITAGTAIASHGEMAFSFPGFALMLLSGTPPQDSFFLPRYSSTPPSHTPRGSPRRDHAIDPYKPPPTTEVCEACKLAAVQALLSRSHLGLIESLYRLTPLAVLLLSLFVAPLELRGMRARGAAKVIREHPLEFAAAASLGFVVNLLMLAVIQATSSLTFKARGQGVSPRTPRVSALRPPTPWAKKQHAKTEP